MAKVGFPVRPHGPGEIVCPFGHIVEAFQRRCGRNARSRRRLGPREDPPHKWMLDHPRAPRVSLMWSGGGAIFGPARQEHG